MENNLYIVLYCTDEYKKAVLFTTCEYLCEGFIKKVYDYEGTHQFFESARDAHLWWESHPLYGAGVFDEDEWLNTLPCHHLKLEIKKVRLDMLLETNLIEPCNMDFMESIKYD